MKWTCKDGTKVSIRKMTDSHLLNTIRFLRRRAPVLLGREISAAWSVLSTLQGDMAQFQCENDISRLEQTDPQEWIENMPELSAMLREAKRRNLEELPV